VPLWGNVEKHGTATQTTNEKTIRCIHFPCRKNKATNTHSRICIPHYFATTTMVSRTRLNDTLYVNCLYGYVCHQNFRKIGDYLSTPVWLCNENSEGVLHGRHSNFRDLVTKSSYWLQHEYVLPLHEVVASCLRNRDSHQLEARGISEIDLAVEGNRKRNDVDTHRRTTNWFIHTSKHCKSSLLITSVAFRK